MHSSVQLLSSVQPFVAPWTDVPIYVGSLQHYLL